MSHRISVAIVPDEEPTKASDEPVDMMTLSWPK